MTLQFDDIELRVLGVLIEKSLTQANAYPLTLNSLVLGTNQKQNRDPVLELSENDVAKAVQRLQHKHMVKQAPPHPGERSNKYLHCVVDTFGWDKREQAIMSELMIRGRQTPGELRTHASRMWNFDELEAVGATLAGLRDRQPAVVEELAREPGRSANRWRHLLGSEAHAPTAHPGSPGFASSPAPPAGAAGPAALGHAAHVPAALQHAPPARPAEADSLTALLARLEALESRVASLAAALDQLRPAASDDALPR